MGGVSYRSTIFFSSDFLRTRATVDMLWMSDLYMWSNNQMNSSISKDDHYMIFSDWEVHCLGLF